MKQITQPMLVQMSERARQVSRLRSNHNFHPELDDAIQRLAIAMEPLTYVRPHRHPHTWELLTALSGHFVVLLFNDQEKSLSGYYWVRKSLSWKFQPILGMR